VCVTIEVKQIFKHHLLFISKEHHFSTVDKPLQISNQAIVILYCITTGSITITRWGHNYSYIGTVHVYARIFVVVIKITTRLIPRHLL